MEFLFLQLTFFFLKAGVIFAYIQVICAIVSAQHKNNSFDLQGWEYRSFEASMPGIVHRYYNLSEPQPDAPVLQLIHGLNLDGTCLSSIDRTNNV